MKNLLRTSMAICFTMIASSIVADSSSATFERMRQNLQEKITLGPLDYDANEPYMRAYLDSLVVKASMFQQSMRKDTNFLWNDLDLLTGVPQHTPFYVHYSYQRLETMTRAWAYPGTKLYHDAQLVNDIRFGLGLLYRVAYNENTPMCGNWWEWRIGNTSTYSQIVSILYDQLTPEEISQYEKGGSRHVRAFVKKGNMTYANLADVCRNLFMIGVLTSNAEDIQTAMTQAIPAFVDQTTPYQRIAANAAHDKIIRDQSKYQHNTIVWKKEGLYEDGTFIQHIAIPYIGSYGASMIHLTAVMTQVLEGTNWQVPQPIQDVLPTWVNKTYIPEFYKGEIMLMFMGRGNARNPYKSARTVALNMIASAPLIKDSAERDRMLRVCADMIATDKHYASPYEDMAPLPVYQPQLDAAIAYANTTQGETDKFSIVYAAGDRVVHQMERARVGIAMSSNRIGKYEAFTRAHGTENTYAWYTGDGMTYIYTPNDPRQYWQYIPLMNHYRVPGTTVDMLEREPCASNMITFDSQPKAADVARAGGVMMDGVYSSAMMQLLGSRSDLMAKKSWFCFDNEVVCLGADINLDADREVITTVENRQNTSGKASFKLAKQYAYLPETGGYYFPQHTELHTHVSENGFNELWLSHGTAPQNADYQYVLLPMLTEKETKQYTKKPDVEILSNTAEIQAVKENTLGITAVNFWQAGTLGIISSDGMAAVLMRQAGDTLYLNVSEPTWERTQQQFTLQGTYHLLRANPDSLVTITNQNNQTLITVNALYRLGMTQYIALVRNTNNQPATFGATPAFSTVSAILSQLTDEEKIQLQSIYEPRIVAVPIKDARRYLVVMPDGEIRQYGKVDYSSSNPNGRKAYLSSRDAGLSWKLHYSNGVMGECTYLKEPNLYIKLYVEKSLDLDPDASSLGTYVWTSTIGPEDVHPTKVKLLDQAISLDYFGIQQSRYSKRIFTTASINNPQDERERLPRFFYSDDWGKTWQIVNIQMPPVYPQTAPDLAPRWRYCGVEPVAVELAENEIMMLLRNASDYFYWTFSHDGGETWEDIQPSPFHGDATTPYLLKLEDGRLLTFWNNTLPLPENDHTALELDSDAVSGRWEDAFTNRDAAHVAISEDNGKTWIGARELLLSMIRNRSDFRYYGSMESSHDKSVHQYQAIELPYNKVLVHVGQNEVSRKLMIFDINWLYEIYRHEDFMDGMENVTAHSFLKSLSGCTLAAAGNGHCQWNRIQGAVMAPDPTGVARDVVHVSRVDDPRLISPKQGVTWNFPASHDGRVMMEVYLKQDAIRLSLADCWYQPSDPALDQRALLSVVLDTTALSTNTYHQVMLQFNEQQQTCVISIDNIPYQTYPMKKGSSLGISYLILQCEANQSSEGFYVRLLEKDDYK